MKINALIYFGNNSREIRRELTPIEFDNLKKMIEDAEVFDGYIVESPSDICGVFAEFMRNLTNEVGEVNVQFVPNQDVWTKIENFTKDYLNRNPQFNSPQTYHYLSSELWKMWLSYARSLASNVRVELNLLDNGEWDVEVIDRVGDNFLTEEQSRALQSLPKGNHNWFAFSCNQDGHHLVIVAGECREHGDGYKYEMCSDDLEWVLDDAGTFVREYITNRIED